MAENATNTTSDAPEHRYTAKLAGYLERKWQGVWEERGTYRVPNPGEPGFDASRPKFYALDMFPYPSGAGLHVGHPEGYTATDIISRYKRMQGFGFSYDWGREFATIDEDYYRWTQWIFVQIYNSWYDEELSRCRPISELIQLMEGGTGRVSIEGELVRITKGEKATEALGGEPMGVRQWHELNATEQRTFIDNYRLAYVGEQTVNWCPALGTVLANEEVIDGRSERGGHPVLRKPLKQWLFRITALADRLLNGLDELDWPESTKTQQREWIGRSEGAEIDFELGLDLGLYDKARHDFRRDVHGRRARARYRRLGTEGPARWDRCRRACRVCRGRPQPLRQGPDGEQGQDRVLHRAVCDQSRQW